MTAMAFFGNALTAYGPAIAVLAMYIGRSARLFMLMLASAFMWLLAVLVIASVAYFVPAFWKDHLPTLLAFACVLQELARYGLFLLFRNADSVLNLISRDPLSLFNRHHHAFAGGFGFGIMSALIQFIKPLSESASPGMIECISCPGTDVFFIGAIMTCLFIFLHTTWGVIAFDGWFKNQWYQFAWVFLSHLGVSMGTIYITRPISYGCLISIFIAIAVLAVNACACLLVLKKVKQQ